MWGIDVIGAIEPKASNGHRFILVTIDYFTKWVEVASYASVTRKVVVRFIKREIICKYGLPRKIITDNATNLNNKMMKEMCEDFKIQHHNSMSYRPKMKRNATQPLPVTLKWEGQLGLFISWFFICFFIFYFKTLTEDWLFGPWTKVICGIVFV